MGNTGATWKIGADKEITLWKDRKRTIFGLPLSFTLYYVTETRLFTRRGFLNVVEDELELYKITDKKLNLPLGQRIFGCGTIVLYAKDTDTPLKEITCIKNPKQVFDMLSTVIGRQRDKYNVRGRDMTATAEGEESGN